MLLCCMRLFNDLLCARLTRNSNGRAFPVRSRHCTHVTDGISKLYENTDEYESQMGELREQCSTESMKKYDDALEDVGSVSEENDLYTEDDGFYTENDGFYTEDEHRFSDY